MYNKDYYIAKMKQRYILNNHHISKYCVSWHNSKHTVYKMHYILA